MRVQSIDLVLRVALLVGVVCYFAVILFLLKHKKLTVRYAIVWLLSGVVLLIFAVFPYIVLVLRDLLKVQMPANLVFMLAIAFILLMLLSLTSIASGHAETERRLVQEHALLEQRVRVLEAQLAQRGGAAADMQHRADEPAADGENGRGAGVTGEVGENSETGETDGTREAGGNSETGGADGTREAGGNGVTGEIEENRETGGTGATGKTGAAHKA